MKLNESIEIYGRMLANRVVLQPMEGCDGNFDGSISELTRRRYLRFAESGAGIIWFEATATSKECRANPRQLYLDESTLPSYKKLLCEIRETAIEKCGKAPVIILQSTNSGRWSKPNGTPEPIIAYHNELWEKGKENLPYTVATDEYCDGIIEKYGKAAALAKEAGFDGIDVKCCHGYLFNEFLSAFERKGRYGGSFENRTRLFFDCIDEVKRNCGDLFITTRLNATDTFPYPYGYGINADNEIDLTETKKIISVLKGRGIELINLTLGNPYLIPHINRPCKDAPESAETGMERIYNVTKELQTAFPEIKFIMSGLSFNGENSVDYAEKCLEEGVASLAGFGRMSFCYPQFWKDYCENGRLNKAKTCLGCAKCTELMRHGSVTGCPVRDGEIYMPYYRKYVLSEK